ncbi:ROK family protein [Lacticaseibacillus hegangensis]|uniref:ROK family protein n=1 Tax=Lacticaseibacillus hegangensis TaxID=2486010 RepID=A0ABW4CVM0_9LACO|nr:ROK family protein [Lacticaseibacillus hegangensis]
MQDTDTVIAIDVGGTKILIGELTPTGKILATQRYPSLITTQSAVEALIEDDLRDFLANHNLQGKPRAIGLGIVGRVDADRGVWEEIDPDRVEPVTLAGDISAAFNLPCVIHNDVTSATIAEQTLGVGKKYKDFVYLNVGTGIAAGIVSDNKLITGYDHDAGEVGHMVVDMHSKVLCSCGRYGCVEALASGLGMSKRANSLLKAYPTSDIRPDSDGRISAESLFTGYDHGDELSRLVVSEAAHALAELIMNLTKTLNPQAFVLGGGVMTKGWMLRELERDLVPETMRFITGGVELTDLDPSTIALEGAAVAASRLY